MDTKLDVLIESQLPFRDPNTLCRVDHVVGAVTSAVEDADQIILKGHVSITAPNSDEVDQVLALDKSGRFVSIAPLTSGHFALKIGPKRLGNDNSALAVSVYAIGPFHNFAYPLRLEPKVGEAYAAYVKPKLDKDGGDVPTLAPALRKAVTEAMQVSYVAISNHDTIRTPSSYQTLKLDDQVRFAGGRQDRTALLRAVDFKGKKVLDLGANMGENSRIARYLGADLVDGYEYDPHFVEIGRAVNAISGVTRVSLFQGDATLPALYSGMTYDVVLALNVWVYLTRTIALLPDVAPLMVFETHTLDHGMNYYYSRVLPHYKHAACIGLTDVVDNPSKSRALIVFSNDLRLIERHVARKYLIVQPYFNNEFIEKHSGRTAEATWALAEKCFEARKGRAIDLERLAFGKYEYFEMLLAGLHQFRTEGNKLSMENVFVSFYADAIKGGAVDSSLSFLLKDESWLLRKVGNKFEDLIQIISGHPERVPPVRVIEAEDGVLKLLNSEGRMMACNVLDGHHRLFGCQLMGVKRIHYI